MGTTEGLKTSIGEIEAYPEGGAGVTSRRGLLSHGSGRVHTREMVCHSEGILVSLASGGSHI